MNNNRTNRMLGFPSDARLLIVNADDFGMCNSINEAIICTLKEGLVRSTTLMAPCPWANQAMQFLADNPEIPFGIHLTVISDPVGYQWGPLTPWDKLPSLVDRVGHFYRFEAMHAHLAQVKLDQLELEFRAQIESVLTTGLKPTHLDWHALRFGDRTDIYHLIIQLAREYGLAVRVLGQASINQLQSQDFPTGDFDFLDSYLIDANTKSARYVDLLRELPVGLSEWAVHPGFDNAELLAMEPTGNHERQTDLDFWISQQAKEIVKAEGIVLIDYRLLQAIWRAK